MPQNTTSIARPIPTLPQDINKPVALPIMNIGGTSRQSFSPPTSSCTTSVSKFQQISLSSSTSHFKVPNSQQQFSTPPVNFGSPPQCQVNQTIRQSQSQGSIGTNFSTPLQRVPSTQDSSSPSIYSTPVQIFSPQQNPFKFPNSSSDKNLSAKLQVLQKKEQEHTQLYINHQKQVTSCNIKKSSSNLEKRDTKARTESPPSLEELKKLQLQQMIQEKLRLEELMMHAKKRESEAKEKMEQEMIQKQTESEEEFSSPLPDCSLVKQRKEEDIEKLREQNRIRDDQIRKMQEKRLQEKNKNDPDKLKREGSWPNEQQRKKSLELKHSSTEEKQYFDAARGVRERSCPVPGEKRYTINDNKPLVQPVASVEIKCDKPVEQKTPTSKLSIESQLKESAKKQETNSQTPIQLRKKLFRDQLKLDLQRVEDEIRKKETVKTQNDEKARQEEKMKKEEEQRTKQEKIILEKIIIEEENRLLEKKRAIEQRKAIEEEQKRRQEIALKEKMRIDMEKKAELQRIHEQQRIEQIRIQEEKRKKYEKEQLRFIEEERRKSEKIQRLKEEQRSVKQRQELEENNNLMHSREGSVKRSEEDRIEDLRMQEEQRMKEEARLYEEYRRHLEEKHRSQMDDSDDYASEWDVPEDEYDSEAHPLDEPFDELRATSEEELYEAQEKSIRSLERQLRKQKEKELQKNGDNGNNNELAQDAYQTIYQQKPVSNKDTSGRQYSSTGDLRSPSSSKTLPITKFSPDPMEFGFRPIEKPIGKLSKSTGNLTSKGKGPSAAAVVAVAGAEAGVAAGIGKLVHISCEEAGYDLTSPIDASKWDEIRPISSSLGNLQQVRYIFLYNWYLVLYLTHLNIFIL